MGDWDAARGTIAAAKDLLDAVLEAFPASVVLLDRGGRIVLANRHFLDRAGRALAEVTGTVVWGLVPEALVEAARLPEKLDKLFRTGAVVPGERVSFRGPGLSTRILWYRLVPAPRAERLDRVLFVIEDVTAQERATGDVRKALQAQRLAALGVFVAGIAHELRNPLAIASSAAQLLEDGGLSGEEQAACLARIRKGIGRTDRVIQALAALAPMAANEERERVPLAPLVTVPVAWIEKHAVDHGIRMTLSVPDEPLVVDGDRGHLQQAVFAVLLNAVQAMPAGGVLRISARAEGQEAVIRVEDSGPGIAPAVADSIFHPFFTTRPPGEGSGLGLPLCYAAVTRYGGTVTVENSPTKGTVATIRLPLAPAGDAASPGVESVP